MEEHHLLVFFLSLSCILLCFLAREEKQKTYNRSLRMMKKSKKEKLVVKVVGACQAQEWC